MKGTLVFSFVAGAYVVVLWGACFAFSPAQRVVNRLPWKYVKDAYKSGMEKASKNPFLQRFPEEYRGKLMMSFGEMLTMKVILGPVALPFKVWLTYEILKYV
jgi:hypothetical protein